MQPLPQWGFRGIAAAATILTVSWWRDWLPVEAWLRADPNPAILAGQYVLRTLLHGDGVHLMFNLYWVYAWVPRIEQRHGAAPVLAAWIWLALGTNGVSHLLHENGIGFSGIVYAMLGFLWASERDLPDEQKIVSWKDVQFFAGWFVLCVVLTTLNLWNIGNIAHGSGAVLGLLLGIATRWPRPAQIALAVAVPVLAVLV